jgi:ornithine carbamoyltransferase
MCLCYIGEGNNTASAFALAVSQIPGMRLTLMTPEGYGLPAGELAKACSIAKETRTDIQQLHDLGRLPSGVDVVYTTRWLTMGQPKERSQLAKVV